MTHDCTQDGHVIVTGDPECLACGQVPVIGDQVRLIGVRFDPEPLGPLDTAQAPEWGPLGF